MYCSRTQCSDAGEARTRGPSVSSQALYHWATALPFYYVCCIYSDALQTYLITEANTMNPDGAVWFGFILFAIKATKLHKQMRQQTTIVVKSGKRVFLVYSLLAGKGLTSWLSFAMLNDVFVTFPCGMVLDCIAIFFTLTSSRADPEGRTGVPDPPWKITSYMGFYMEYAIGPPLKKVGPPKEDVGPPLEPWKVIDFFEINHLTSVK